MARATTLIHQAAFGLVGACLALQAGAQCGTPIAAFPYDEGFEAGPAWTSGGTASDWAWGTPAHPLINSAGGGTRSWCAGGLTGAFYNSNERSYLESPCFDFTTLDRPRISFKLFWETERTYDGLTFQYSTDGGASYTTLGGFNETVDCLTAYWFNTTDVTNLGPQAAGPGWSGRVGATSGNCAGGNGSHTWVTAKHCLGLLAHEPSVRFRFFFGAGSQCNGYDGIAIDDIRIEESDPVVAQFDFSCAGNTVDFTSFATPCPNVFAWDFGDPGSGALNASPQENPSHTYPGPGTYTVTFTATDACGATASVQHDISVLGVSVQGQSPTCGQPNGSATATVTGASGPVDYAWSPGGGTAATITGLDAGTYTVTVSATGACAASASVTLDPPTNALVAAVTGTDVSCSGLSDGSAVVTVAQGVGPYTFAWTDGEGTAATATGLDAGPHTCVVTDGAGCSVQVTVDIAEPPPLTVDAGTGITLCTGGTVTLVPQAAGGTPPYTYAWSPAGPVVTPTATTTYAVTATDANGCVSLADDVTVQVSAAGTPSITSTEATGCAPHCVTFAALPAGQAAYAWDLGDGTLASGEAPAHCYVDGGSYTVTLTVTDAAGCSASVVLPDHVQVRPPPEVSFVAQPPFVTSDAPLIRFINTSADDALWVWDFGDPGPSLSLERSPVFAYAAVGCYTVRLEGTSPLGCVGSAAAEVCMEDPYTLFVPNTFTPDNDDINDSFRVYTSVMRPQVFSLVIYDRWGKALFTSTDVQGEWSGEGVDPGLYTWKLHLVDARGVEHDHIGHITLLR